MLKLDNIAGLNDIVYSDQKYGKIKKTLKDPEDSVKPVDKPKNCQHYKNYKEYNNISLVDKIPDELRRVNFYKLHNPAVKRKNDIVERKSEEFKYLNKSLYLKDREIGR